MAGTTTSTFSFNDIFKNSFLEQQQGIALTPVRVLSTLGVALLLGLFILFIYRKTFSGVLYSRSFGLSMVIMTMVTALVIMPVMSNTVLSLGMVGALSIVRFRTAVKDAMDTMYLFWCVAVGIGVGAGYFAVGALGTLAIGLVMVAMTMIKLKTALPFLLVLHFHEQVTPEVRKLMATLGNTRLKSKVRRGETVELTMELRLGQDQDMIADKFLAINGVYDASLLSYQGDMIS